MIPENATLFSISLLGKKIRLNVRENSCDVTASRGEYIRAALWIREWNVEPLELLWSFVCSASLEAGELSAIESAIIVVISDFLTVCVAKSQSAELLLPVNCCLFTLLIF
ncbi:hypothetical protein AVEN_235593-1 [Araneus ventricosus]|uniref:Uncharacterized protein n=1 Tax=Araneus ventricosus TaxID=182803 RepID=A0A4Y2BRB1_ARAVE|nr:hypothetical protein AVEN_235593-1 [Araneus ventricosus]